MSSRPTMAQKVRWIATLVAVVVLAIVAATVGGSGSPPNASGPGEGFVTREGNQLMLDGEPFYYAGTNNYELMYQGPAVVDNFFALAAEEESTVVRAWAFFDIGALDGDLGVEISNKGTYFQYFDKELGRPVYNDGADGLEQLDYMVYSAKQHGIKLVLPFVNNWGNFGGIDQYVRWAGLDWHDDFLRDETIKTWYKEWVAHLLERENIYTGVKYKDEPTIMVWELANEMRCSSAALYLSSPLCGNNIMEDWVREMSDYVRSIDGNHLIGFGGEGFLCPDNVEKRPRGIGAGGDNLYNCGESVDPATVLAMPNIDVHGIHVYPDHWNTSAEWANWWLETHGGLADAADKPFYIGEYGWIDGQTRLPVYRSWLDTFYASGGDGSHFWIMHPAASLAADPDGVGFTEECPSPICTMIANYSVHFRDGVPWSEFSPLGTGDFVTTPQGVPITFAVPANDMAFGDAVLDLDSVDLDPETPGVQAEFTHEKGVFTVEGGDVTFTPYPDSTGSARAKYVIADSEGRVTDPISVSVSMQRPREDS